MSSPIQEHKYPISQWAKDEQPRGKLRNLGAESLSNAELLAILINNGTPQHSALELARELLKRHQDNLDLLGAASMRQIKCMQGIGEAKATVILAALELGRRRSAGDIEDRLVVAGSQDVASFLKSRLADNRHEVFAVIYLNQSNRIRFFEIISEGGITGTVVDPRILLKRALEEDATALILCHNHPSGNLKPSRADEDLTRKLIEAARFFDIRILDHIIVSQLGYFSFADEGRL